MAEQQKARKKYDPVRTTRVPDVVWAKAQRRATYEGQSMSTVVRRLVAAYAEGKVDLPQMRMVYAQKTEE